MLKHIRRKQHLLVLLIIGHAAALLQRPVDQPKRTSLTFGQRLVAGGTSRMAGQLFLYPVDALRTMAQSRPAASVGTIALLRQLGAQKLLSGCVTTSGFALLVGGLQFSIIGTLSSTLGTCGASVCGAFGSCLASVPQEVIKQRLIMGVYPNFAAAVSTIARTEGILGFYSGWVPTASRNVPFVVATFTSHAFLQRRLLAQKALREEGAALTVEENLFLGVSSALVGALVTQPMDVIKTRMMTQASSGAIPYTSIADCISTMWRAEGVTSFFRGLPQRTVYMGPLWAIQFAMNAWVTERMLRTQ